MQILVRAGLERVPLDEWTLAHKTIEHAVEISRLEIGLGMAIKNCIISVSGYKLCIK